MNNFQKRQERRIQPHFGRLTPAERDSLKNCVLNGDRPFPNLIEAGYALENEKTGEWYLVESGYEKLRFATLENKVEAIHSS
jgi:hypothetical protein